jgi:hypothetical protein
MRFLFKLFLFAGVLVIVGAGALAWLALDDRPVLTRDAQIKPESIERARRLIERHDPRRQKAGVLRSAQVGAADLDLAANYLAQRYARGAARVVLGEGTAEVRVSSELPGALRGRWLNLAANLGETSGLPRVEALRVGSLPVPRFLADLAVSRGLAHLEEHAGQGAVADTIKAVRMRGGVLAVDYEWSDALPERLRALVLPPVELERLRTAQARLAEALAGTRPGDLDLERALQPLMRHAAERAATRPADAALENRAALVVLAFHVNGKGLGAVAPAARDWPRPAPRNVVLAGRRDFAQHFTISAALAAAAGSPLADAIGLYKEVDDSRGGSGFSFNDIAADRAGARFGELAVRDAAGAAKAQRAGLASEYFPEVRDLPEFIAEPEFKRRFGGIGAPAYRKMMADIEARIAALPLYR